jgi:hypothetical protein
MRLSDCVEYSYSRDINQDMARAAIGAILPFPMRIQVVGECTVKGRGLLVGRSCCLSPGYLVQWSIEGYFPCVFVLVSTWYHHTFPMERRGRTLILLEVECSLSLI